MRVMFSRSTTNQQNKHIIYKKTKIYIYTVCVGCSQMQISKSVLKTNVIQYPKPRVPSLMALIDLRVSLLKKSHKDLSLYPGHKEMAPGAISDPINKLLEHKHKKNPVWNMNSQ